ncbi:hypothetical protein [Lysinibacillus sp. NPDC056232]|uniref:hypothetical protein n=1 Tax=Lysinibacillus sp. NPDC056232 TaxID=3345756 RepID=UPI0035DBED99
MFSARKRSANEAAAAPMLVTKALSQDVMVLAFVPLLLIPKESPSLHSNQLIYNGIFFNKYHLSLSDEPYKYHFQKSSNIVIGI